MYRKLDEKVELLAKEIVDSCFSVHKELGPGLLESVYEACLLEELRLRNIKCESQVYLPIIYKGNQIDNGYRLDILVENSIILELKSVEKLLPIHKAQTLTYLKLTKHSLAFLINFNVPLIKDGIVRLINN